MSYCLEAAVKTADQQPEISDRWLELAADIESDLDEQEDQVVMTRECVLARMGRTHDPVVRRKAAPGWTGR